jgi:hypothetical protein
MRAALDDRGGLTWIAPACGEAPGDQRQLPDPHVEDQRAREAGERVPVERGARLLGILVARDERHRGGGVAVGHRDARIRGGGDARRHARHHLERHAGRGEHLGLLAAAAEHERIPALQPHDALAGARELDEQGARLVL